MSKHKYSKEFLERTGMTEEELDAKTNEDSPESFTETAIGLFRVKDGGGHKYTLVEIPYNPQTGTAGAIKPVMSEHSKEEMVNQFKFKVDQLNLFFYQDSNE